MLSEAELLLSVGNAEVHEVDPNLRRLYDAEILFSYRVKMKTAIS